ncbi:MAG: tryptophan synthase subunit alpha [Micavibrio aeruginosavorus]|uniref:Tryptophan synthase alpha chain n=1 Tax=Micavibrio aeruginosavorus TaxID=349221 RepID=A0A7T5R2A5_9BACT|nr:MAG: tryptophan synthase subunit alpha [Micavibrio aeruginosavorus]
MNRIDQRFAKVRQEERAALVTFIMAGDPDKASAQDIMNGLPAAGADIIEIGMPFSDPMADGLTIQLAGQRALAGGMTLAQTLDMVKSFRVHDTQTPVVLMGYYNPVYIYGAERFVIEAVKSGVDGVIIVDLPPEEEAELGDHARAHNLNMIRLVTPTTDDNRLRKILPGAGGFLYYVSITGITGAAAANAQALTPRLKHLKTKTDLPLAVGFGIRTPDDVAALSEVSDAVVVGSAIVETIGKIGKGQAKISDVITQVTALASALRQPARKRATNR